MTNKMIIARVGEIQDYATFDDWSRGFCESIIQQLNRGRNLSERQMQVLTRIFNENSAEEVENHNKWEGAYKQHWAEKAKVLCDYYETQGQYFSNVRLQIQNGTIPARHSFMKMAANKYAVKLLAEWRKEPQYPVGTSVIAREAQLSRWGAKSTLKKGGVVLTTDEKIITSAKGSKRYKVLPYDSNVPILVEERDIKLFRRTRRRA